MRAVALLCTTVAAALAISGCSIKDGNPDVVAGKELFVQKCGSCHILARAGTKGTVGPNLDEAFARSKAEGFGEDAILGVVRKQIEFPSVGGSEGNGLMPADLVDSEGANDVAAYVAMSVAEPGKDTGLLATVGQAKVSDKPAVAENGVITIPADPTGQLVFSNGTAEGPAGELTLDMPNTSGVPHNIAIEGKGTGEVVEEGNSKFTATFAPGKYEYICEVTGHLAAGMKGTLTVK